MTESQSCFQGTEITSCGIQHRNYRSFHQGARPAAGGVQEREQCCSLCLHTLSCLLCSYSIRHGAWADGHVLVVLASTRDVGFFMLLCWLYSVPGEADRNGSSFSLGLSRSLAFLIGESEGGQEKTAQGSQGSGRQM